MFSQSLIVEQLRKSNVASSCCNVRCKMLRCAALELIGSLESSVLPIFLGYVYDNAKLSYSSDMRVELFTRSRLCSGTT